MSLRSLLMPWISRRLLSEQTLQRRREHAERRRIARGEPHRVQVFLQADDPYSALLAEALPAVLERYNVVIDGHVAGPPPDAAAPARELLVAYSRRDTELLARHLGLDFRDPGRQPAPEAVGAARARLVAAIAQGRLAEAAAPVLAALWRGVEGGGGAVVAGPSTPAAGRSIPAGNPAAVDLHWPEADAAEVQAHGRAADALRQRLGHYLGAMLHYGGEWYWGLDRLHHLELRLQALGAGRAGTGGVLYPPPADLREPVVPDALPPGAPPPIEFFVSLRSPYSAIVVPRVYELGRLTGAEVRLRPVLPMVMRGLPVPAPKRRYISLDAAREARLRGVPFGVVNDPLGRPTERGMAVLAHARSQGRGPAFLRSFMQGVWAEGLDAGSNRGLRRMAERAGLDWAACTLALGDEAWRHEAEANRREMAALGLWGVPSFRVGPLSVWGQDRLWAVQQALQTAAPPAVDSVSSDTRGGC